MSSIKKMLKELNSENTKSRAPIPIWLLNSRLSSRDILEKIGRMQEQGIVKFAVRAEKGVIPDYNTRDFWSAFTLILRTAKVRKMQVLLADDLQYANPGLYAGLTGSFRKHRQKYLSLCRVLKVKGAKKLVHDFDEDNIEYVFALKQRDKILDFNSLRNISGLVKAGRLSWNIPSGDWRIFIFNACYNKKPVGQFVLNCFDADTARAYVNAAFAHVKRIVPKDAQAALSGFLCELPNIGPDTSIRAIPWSLSILKALRSACHADVATLLLALFIDNYSKKNGLIRRGYYNLLLKLFANNFMRPLKDFCTKNRLEILFLLNNGDLFSSDAMLRFNYEPVLQKFTVSGMAGNISYAFEQSTPLRLFADLMHFYGQGSNATVIGRNRNGVGYGLKDLKFDSDHLSLAGIHANFIDGNYCHLKYRSGRRAPVNTFTYSGDFHQYHRLVGALARKAALFSKLPHQEAVGVVYPCEGLYAAYNPSNLTVYRGRIRNIDALITQLAQGGVPFNLLTENLASQLTVSNKGEAVLRSKNKVRASFRILIVPESLIVHRKFISLLEKFIKKGGSVIFFGVTPCETFEAGKNPRLLKQVEKLQGQMPGSVTKLTKLDELESLKDICFKTIEKPVEIYSESENEKRILLRTFTDGKANFYYFLNTSHKDNVRCEIKINDYGYIYYLDLNQGTLCSLPFTNNADEIRPFIYSFGPGEAAVLVLTDSRVAASSAALLPVEDTGRVYRIILKDEWEFRPLDHNALPLNSWSMRINSNREVNTGFNMAYESYINVESIPPRALVMFNSLINHPINGLNSGYHPVEVSFNGVILKPMQFFGRGEKAFRETEQMKPVAYGGITDYAADVTPHVRKGINRITVKTFGSSFHPRLIKYPLIFLGDFALKRGNQGWLVSQKKEIFNYGSWTDQGYPFFCGSGVYQQTFEKPGSYKKVFLRFKNFESSVRVRVNGHEVSFLPWQPAVAEISKFIQSDKNRIEIEIASTHNNILKMINMPAGLTAEAYLDIYQ